LFPPRIFFVIHFKSPIFSCFSFLPCFHSFLFASLSFVALNIICLYFFCSSCSELGFTSYHSFSSIESLSFFQNS
jgi:hypothetical protein